MTTTTTPTPTPLQATLTLIGNQLKADVLGVAKSGLVNFFTNVKANPTVQNVAAQGALLQASLLLSAPTLEQESISQVAQDALDLLNKL